MMSAAPITPTEDPFEPSTAVSWTNHSIPYNKNFEDSVMRVVLSPPPADGIKLLNEGDEARSDMESIQRNDVDQSTLPSFGLSDLPLPLDHPSRIYHSTVPGIRLTHPGGLLEGGSGPGAATSSAAAERASFAQDIIDEQRVRKASQFWAVVEREKEDAVKELEDRMRARQQAAEQNEKIDLQLDTLREQRDLEVRVWERRMGMAKG